MIETTEIEDNVIKFSGASNVYLLDFDEKILIDCGDRSDHESLKKAISKYTNLSKISKVILTHLHYDHVGNVDLFPDAEFFASKEAIESFEKDPLGTVLNKGIAEVLKGIRLRPVKDIYGLKIIDVPGHTIGSIAIWHEKHSLLFSGDTVFVHGVGRIDLPTSSPDDMSSSLEVLKRYNPKKLCPGHDY